MHKILVLGSTGMLGQALVKHAITNNFNLYTASRTDISSFQLDVLDFEKREKSFIDFLKQNQIEYVINAIGVLVQESSTNFRNAIEINGYFPIRLANICDSINCKLVHISTDCVYSGSSGPIKRLQIPDPKDAYGVSKYIGEFSQQNCMVIRTSIIGEDNSVKPQGLLNWVLSNNHSIISGYTNAYWSGVTTDYLAYFIFTKVIIESKYRKGLFNLATNCISKYELIQSIIDSYKLKITLNHHKLENPIDKCLISDFGNIPEIHKQLKNIFVI